MHSSNVRGCWRLSGWPSNGRRWRPRISATAGLCEASGSASSPRALWHASPSQCGRTGSAIHGLNSDILAAGLAPQAQAGGPLTPRPASGVSAAFSNSTSSRGSLKMPRIKSLGMAEIFSIAGGHGTAMADRQCLNEAVPQRLWLAFDFRRVFQPAPDPGGF